jgi:hypothetical protein
VPTNPNSSNVKTGTGFFYNVPAADGVFVPTLVTNKHVIEGALSADFVVHSATQAGAKKPDSNRNFTSPISAWISHLRPALRRGGDAAMAGVARRDAQLARWGRFFWALVADFDAGLF